jgi:hypothetical protein
MAVALIAHVSEDGYLYGAGLADEHSVNWRYWHPTGSEECQADGHHCSLVTLKIDNPGDAEVMTRHGSNEQYHSDGYEAWNYLRIIGQEIA